VGNNVTARLYWYIQHFHLQLWKTWIDNVEEDLEKNSADIETAMELIRDIDGSEGISCSLIVSSAVLELQTS